MSIWIDVASSIFKRIRVHLVEDEEAWYHRTMNLFWKGPSNKSERVYITKQAGDYRTKVESRQQIPILGKHSYGTEHIGTN